MPAASLQILLIQSGIMGSNGNSVPVKNLSASKDVCDAPNVESVRTSIVTVQQFEASRCGTNVWLLLAIFTTKTTLNWLPATLAIQLQKH